MSELLNEPEPQEELNSEDEWYARMEQAALGQDEEEEEEVAEVVNQTEQVEETEEKYFEKMLAHNIETSDQLFLEENDLVWNKIVNNLAQDNLNPPLSLAASSKTTASSSSSVSTPGSSLSQDVVDSVMLYEVKENDHSLHILIQNWLFNFLPESSKLYFLFLTPSLLYGEEKNYRVFINNKTNPTFLALVTYDDKILYDLRISLFISYFNSQFYSIYDNYLKILISFYVKKHTVKHIKFTGVHDLYHEGLLSKMFSSLALTSPSSSSSPSSPFFYEECCYQYQLSPEIFNSLETHKTFQERVLPPGFYYDVLQEKDAQIVNDTWKYKNDGSVHMIKKMIQANTNVCIRHQSQAEGEAEGEGERYDPPAAWCLVYDDGALGMLQALPAYRGKGFAKSVVIKLIRNLKSSGFPIANFCFIETKNTDSMVIFNSLGFQQGSGFVWSGLIEDPETLVKKF